jgi:hypothetical protein
MPDESEIEDDVKLSEIARDELLQAMNTVPAKTLPGLA